VNLVGRDSPAGARRGGVPRVPAAEAGRPGAPGRWRSVVHVYAHDMLLGGVSSIKRLQGKHLEGRCSHARGDRHPDTPAPPLALRRGWLPRGCPPAHPAPLSQHVFVSCLLPIHFFLRAPRTYVIYYIGNDVLFL